MSQRRSATSHLFRRPAGTGISEQDRPLLHRISTNSPGESYRIVVFKQSIVSKIGPPSIQPARHGDAAVDAPPHPGVAGLRPGAR